MKQLSLCLLVSVFWACGVGCQNSAPPPPPPLSAGTQYLWVANASAVNFDGLIEVQKPDVDLGRPLYEGFFEPYRPGNLTLDRPADAPLFTPEAEWVLYFPYPGQLDGNVDEVTVEVRGMIEGKWLDYLQRGGASNWRKASAGNNVVAQPRSTFAMKPLRMSVAALDEALAGRTFNPRIEVREKIEGREAEGRVVFYASFADAYPFLDTYGGNDPDSPFGAGERPVRQLVEDVYRAFRKVAPCGAELAGIDLTALGANAALVNDPVRKATVVRQNATFRSIAKPFGQLARVEGMKKLIAAAREQQPAGVTCTEAVTYEVRVYRDVRDKPDNYLASARLHLNCFSDGGGCCGRATSCK